jgi:DcuC family C4-dicarboxylate transporter
VAELLAGAVRNRPELLLPLAGGLPFAFALLCGSGMATTQSLFGFYVEPAGIVGIDPVHVGAVVAVAASAGRTMSPVAAITLLSASLTGTRPLELVRRVALPLLVATTVTVAIAAALARG